VYLLEQKDIKHVSAVLIVFSSTFLIFALFLAFLIPALSNELSNIQENIDVYSKTLTDKYEDIQSKLFGAESPLNLFIKKKNIREEVDSYLNNKLYELLRKMSMFVFSAISFFMNLIVIPFAVFFFLLDEQRIKKKLIGAIPNHYFEVSLKVLHSLNIQFGCILQGMFISVVIISLLSLIGLWVIGLRYPIIIGVIAGLSNLIPFLGPIVGDRKSVV
jgi:predicted PurR-regulated permease PerM